MPNDIQIDGYANCNIDGTSPIKYVVSVEVAELVSKINPKKSPGRNRITRDMIKELQRMRIFFLTKIINAAFRFKYVPKDWKEAKIIMIIKAGKNSEGFDSYRPISILFIELKIFEGLY